MCNKSFTELSQHTFCFRCLYILHKQWVKSIKCAVGQSKYLKEYFCHKSDDRVSYGCKAWNLGQE